MNISIEKTEPLNMGLLGDFAKGFVIVAGILCVYAIVSFAAQGYSEVALLFLITLLIPVSMIAFEYWKYKQHKKARSVQQKQS